MSSANLNDPDNLNSARSQSIANDMKSPTRQGSNNRFDDMENALQPLLEKITDPSEELYFQDANGRLFKIMMCEA